MKVFSIVYITFIVDILMVALIIPYLMSYKSNITMLLGLALIWGVVYFNVIIIKKIIKVFKEKGVDSKGESTK